MLLKNRRTRRRGNLAGILVLAAVLVDLYHYQAFDDDAPLAAAVADDMPSVAASASPLNDDDDLFAKVVQQRQLQSPRAASLLRHLAQQHAPSYNATADFLIYEHELKSGGTSLSEWLANHLPRSSVVPGSHTKDYFRHHEFQAALQNASSANYNFSVDDWWRPHRLVYSHDFLQTPGRRPSDFEQRLVSIMPPSFQQERNWKILSLIRDPLSLVASNWAAWICGIKVQVRQVGQRWQGEGRLERGWTVGQLCTQLNLTELTHQQLHYDLPQMCQTRRIVGRDLHPHEVQACHRWNATGGRDPKPYCRSPTALMASRQFDMVHNKYRRYYDDATTPTMTVAALEEHALQRLGGMTVQAQSRPAPVLWVGVSERLAESLCLLQHTLGLPDDDDDLNSDTEMVPFANANECRPLSFWTSAEQDALRQKEVLGHAVYRAANALLDVRMHQLCTRSGSAAPPSCCAKHYNPKVAAAA